MAEYTLKTPLWTKDHTLYRPGKREVSDAHARELGLVKEDSPAAAGGSSEGTSGGGEVSKGAAVKYPYADLLAANGFTGWAAVKAASDADLLEVDGIGPSRLEEIRSYKG